MLDLLDYRHQVFDLYRTLRDANGDPSACSIFRQTRDVLFRTHPQSALDTAQKAAFNGLRYFDYDPAYRVIAYVNREVEPITLDYELGEDGHLRCTRFGQVQFTLPSGTGTLSLYWIDGYGGGLFLPFGETTNRDETYGGGRYLFDTIKGADLGVMLDEIVLDFNYAYNPSCAYNPRWICPLTPPANRLAFPINAGEKRYEAG